MEGRPETHLKVLKEAGTYLAAGASRAGRKRRGGSSATAGKPETQCSTSGELASLALEYTWCGLHSGSGDRQGPITDGFITKLYFPL